MFDLNKQIKAKLLLPKLDERASSAKAIMARDPSIDCELNRHSSSSSYAPIYDSNQFSGIPNDFGIDITHIEKFVKDSDSLILEKRLVLI